MYQIDWSRAPHWAKFAARDADGILWWYENRPNVCGDYWYSEGKTECADWADSMVERPRDHDL